MVSTKTSVNISDIPQFNGCGYAQWADKMTGIFLLTNTKGVVEGTVVANTGTQDPEPAMPAGAATGAEWTTYNARFNTWNQKNQVWIKKDTDYAADNAKAKGIFAMALDISIWEQVKEKTANKIFDWLKDKYGKEAFIEVLEDFQYICNLKINLSDPNPQLANFMHHYQRLPMQAATNPSGMVSTAKAHAVSESMACLILLSNLPLATANIGQTSLYQSFIEDYTHSNIVADFKLSEVTDGIRTTWAARFASLPPHQQPKKGTFYVSDAKGKGPAIPKPPQAQRNTSIKDKGPTPRFLEQQNTGGSSSSRLQNAPKPGSSRPKKTRRAAKKQSAHMAAPSSDFVLAAPIIINTPSLPGPSSHSVTQITVSGLVH